MKKILLLLLPVLFAAACMKKEAAMPTPDVVKLNIKGFSMDDTLEFVHEGITIATAAANQGFDQTVMMAVKSGKDSIAVRKKGSTETIGQLEVNATPFFQSKKVYFDGATVTDNVELTPVSNPANMGFRASFKTAYPYFYGGPVDIELFEQKWDMNTFEITYHPLNITIPAVGGAFSGFYELPELVSTPDVLRSYKFKVYKAGTKETVFTEQADLSGIPDPQNQYGTIYFTAGESQLLVIDFYYSDATVFDDFSVQDIAAQFR